MPSHHPMGSNGHMSTHPSQPHIGFGSQPSYASNSPNLTGLVCNVHQTTGDCPPPFAGASHTVVGDHMYLFGGRLINQSRAQLSNDIYELDMIRRHWTKVEIVGESPPPRYFHSMCLLGETKLVCYGGMSIKLIPKSQQQQQQQQHGHHLRHAANRSTDALYLQAQRDAQRPPPQQQQQLYVAEDEENVTTLSDVHIFDIPTRTWTYVPVDNPPTCRYAHCATIVPPTKFFSSDSFHNSLHQIETDINGRKIASPAAIDGTGGAEMIIIGGQNRTNNYIDEIAIFNLRSLTWTTVTPFPMSFGAYRGSMFPLKHMKAEEIGAGEKSEATAAAAAEGAVPKPEGDVGMETPGTPIVMYANYNFMNPRLELRIRLPNGQTIEKEIQKGVDTPPGLRFPFTEQINEYLVLGGVNYSSVEQEYSLYALNLRTLNWGRIDAGGAVLSHGSWNSGFLWPRQNKYVVFGNRNRDMERDYRARRVNYDTICMVELESFGLYDNPRRRNPTSNYVSASAPALPPQLKPKYERMSSAGAAGGGRPYAPAALELGKLAMSITEISDMELISLDGERIPVNSHLLSRRWGPYFIRLLREATGVNRNHGVASAVLQERLKNARDTSGGMNLAEFTTEDNRMSTITITPNHPAAMSSANRMSTSSIATTLVSRGAQSSDASSTILMGASTQQSRPTEVPKTALSSLEIPSTQNLIPINRPRMLYLPHTYNTIKLLVHFLYTSSLPPTSHENCTPQALCSLLQLARPYQVDGLLEATVERLHQVLDGRNAAAVFNAAAMAAGNGRGTGFQSLFGAATKQDEELAAIAAQIKGTDITTPASSRPDASRPHPYRRPSTSMSTLSEASTGPSHHLSVGLNPRPPLLRHQSSNLSGSHSRSRSRKPSEYDIGFDSGSSRHRASSVSSNPPDIDSDRGRNPSISTTSSNFYAGLGIRSGNTNGENEIWSCGLSPVVGLQKRGLRGLMEVRHMRRARGMSLHHNNSMPSNTTTAPTANAPGMQHSWSARNLSSLSVVHHHNHHHLHHHPHHSHHSHHHHHHEGSGPVAI